MNQALKWAYKDYMFQLTGSMCQKMHRAQLRDVRALHAPYGGSAWRTGDAQRHA